MIKKMSTFTQFITTEAKPLPLLILADTSSSMSGEKIDTLNRAIGEMIESFKSEGEMDVDIKVAVIEFGGSSAKVHLPLTSASSIEWKPLVTSGMTPMGAAMRIAKEMIEDKNTIPGKSYRPTVVLVSDGMPNDHGWEDALNNLVNEGRSRKADRMALAIGSDASREMLLSFTKDSEKLFEANDASKIREFFQFVTMSVSVRSKSVDPNKIPVVPRQQIKAGSVQVTSDDPFTKVINPIEF